MTSIQLRSAVVRRLVGGCKSCCRTLRLLPAMTTTTTAIRMDGTKSSSKRLYHDNVKLQQQSSQTDYSKLDVTNLQKRGILQDGHQQLVVFDTLHTMQVNACLAFHDYDLFGTYKETNNNNNNNNSGGESFEWMTYGEYGKNVDKCRVVLKDIGVEEHSKIGIISNNRWEWPTIAAAAYSLNANLVPMYEAQLASDWLYILNDSGCTILICATQGIYDTLTKEVLPNTPLVKSVLCLDAPQGEPHAFASAMANVPSQNDDDDEDNTTTTHYSSMIVKPTQDDLANLLYTSGTTGKPKGVELTHLNFCSNIKAAVRGQVMDNNYRDETDRSLAFLPWAHSFGQTCELWASVAHGSSMGICRGVPFILEDLQLVKPTVLFAVPTLYNRIYDGVHNMMESSNPIRKNLMKRALQMGRAQVEAERSGTSLKFMEQLQFNVLDSLVLSKIRDRFGGHMRHGCAGGAALPAVLTNFMDDLGIPVYEGYGLTETSPIIAMNTPRDRKAGTVGKPLDGIKVYIIGKNGQPVGRVGEEGEICCTGPNIMRGYYRNQEATDEVISVAPDGMSRMFHTGDLGCLDEDGFVKVTGRLSEQYKLENGKYVAPTLIEEKIGLSRFISQVVVCGANRPYNSALLVPDWDAIRQELKIPNDVSEEDLANDERVKELIDSVIARSCKSMKKFEIPRTWAFVAPFTATNHMLTPKMSIRRHKVIKTYEDLIGSLYGDDPIVIEAADGVHNEEKAA